MLTWNRPRARTGLLRAGAAPRWALPAALIVVALAAVSCGGDGRFIVGATTSVQDTGLLDVLIEAFRRESGYEVTPIVAGSGQVLELARRGEVDAVITHSPQAEVQLVEEGHGVDRREVMQNSFLLVGPADDPAGAAGAGTIVEAFRRVAAAGAVFVSRGDGSGTNARELARWREAGIDPGGRPWYLESGAGQGQSLLLASDRGAYTLVDSGTFTVLEERLQLEAFVTDDEPNRYAVTRTNPALHEVSEAAALAFADFLTSEPAQGIIAEFGREEYGEPLFLPAAALGGE